MRVITITRHNNPFSGVAEWLRLGGSESSGKATASRYELPEGYSVEHDTVRDPDGAECSIVLTANGVELLSHVNAQHDCVLRSLD